MYQLKILNIYVLIIFLTLTTNVNAYIGPGIGGGLIASILGIILAVISLIVGILWFPIKRLIKKKKKIKLRVIKHLILLLVVISIVELCIILKFKKTVLKLIEQIKKLPKTFKLSNQNEKYEKLYFDLSKNIFFLH